MTITPKLNNKPHSNGLHLIMIRVTQNRKHRFISSEIYIKKIYWAGAIDGNKKKAKYGEWVKRSHPDAGQLNAQIEEKIAGLKSHSRNAKVTDPKSVVKGNDFFVFADDFVKKYDNDTNQASKDAYACKLKKLRDYTGGKLSFDDVDVRFIRNYINHLVTEHKNSVNGYAVDLRKIRAIYIAASKEGFADRNKNPFLHVKIKTEKTKKERLTKEELELIRKADIEGYLVDARNIFLFCVNCMGMRIGDAMRIKWSNISDDYILYSMNKTKDAISIKMTAEVKRIVGYYSDKTDFYLFPYLQKDCNEYEMIKTKTALVNKALKLIAGKAEVNKKVSTHISRHTYAQLALNSGADPRVLQKAFGHSTYATTENYVGELSFKEVNDLNDSIFE